MLVECMHGDLSDPEAVSGSSTIWIKKRKPVRALFFEVKNSAYLAIKVKGSVTASKTDPFMWSVELFWNRFLFLAFGQEFCSKAISII